MAVSQQIDATSSQQGSDTATRSEMGLWLKEPLGIALGCKLNSWLYGIEAAKSSKEPCAVVVHKGEDKCHCKENTA